MIVRSAALYYNDYGSSLCKRRKSKYNNSIYDENHFKDRYGESSYNKIGTKCNRYRVSRDYYCRYPEYFDTIYNRDIIPNSEELVNDVLMDDVSRIRANFKCVRTDPDKYMQDLQQRKRFYSNKSAGNITYNPADTTAKLEELGILSSPNATSNIQHFTEEYYLSYLTKHYDFSLTHNDLISIEKNHVLIVIDKINNYFIKIDKKLKLDHIEVIDHNVYKNKYFIFSFSKVFIKSKLHCDTDSKIVYTSEFVAFSKYPDNKELIKMISDVSRIIYDSLIEQNLDINKRLINMFKEPENQLVFEKIYGNENNLNCQNITIKHMKIDKFYYPFLDTDLLIETYHKSNDKLLILYGENGSGKTKLSTLIATELQNRKYDIVTVAGSDIKFPKVINQLETTIYNQTEKENNICIIIDDLDPKHLNRDHNTEVNIFFNKLLTIIDGNLDLKLKIIITTNHIIKEECDDPMYRSGRLFDSIYIRYLTKNETREILKLNKIKEKDINTFISKSEDKIKQADVAKFINSIQNKITKSYYKDKTIETKIRKKTTGFIK